MHIVDTFGRCVEQISDKNPAAARRLLRTGWRAQDFKFRYLPNRALLPADRYLAHLMMRTMLRPLQNPENAAIVSIFTPCELLHEVGLYPYNAEGISCYLSASRAERAFLQQAENMGLSETLCSYHKTFLGAAENGLLPKPRCIVYTNLACDANTLTFRRLAELYQVPSFFIDVPMDRTPASVDYVAGQLRELTRFLQTCTGKAIEEAALKERLRCSQRTLENFRAFQRGRTGRYVPADLVTPLYAGMTNNLLLGTEAQETYTKLLLRDLPQTGPARGKRIYWMHTIPFWSAAVRERLCLTESAQIVGCELSQTFDLDLDPEHPYEAMASRLVYHVLNGSVTHRIEAGIRHAREAGADGVIWFGHWGCKRTLGGAQLAKQQFEAQGLPLLVLDGDGCDRSRGGEGQTATRLGAFLEMLEGANHA